ncbi:VirB3 family type IV secretion system protein [uncultured Jannaschia sp.]|uniref:VirB3 family type IV secretion system protein n=1 Tax=uncultured Jannaschia sp. TaxID=293347 RepID=UPI002634F559|nr:VirB3 family type IV secretion system protein [uncultured Jannaschia sp.]
MRNPCFLALTRPVSMAGLPMTYLVILFLVVVGGYIVSLSFLWLIGSAALGYAALRALANYDARFLDVIFASLGKTPPTPGAVRGQGNTYHA